MKKLFSMSIFLALSANLLFSQQSEKPFSIWTYQPTFIDNILYKGLSFTNSSFRYKPEYKYSWIDFAWFTSPGSFRQIDLGMFRFKYFKIGLFSWFPTDGPTDLKYLFPIGIELPVFTAKKYSLSFGSDLYLIKASLVESSLYEYYRPIFLDNQLRLENHHFVRVTAILGYRIQLSDWKSVTIDSRPTTHSGNLNGLYAGIAFSLGKKEVSGNGYEPWEKVRSSRSGYADFVEEYPRSPFSNQRILVKVATRDPDPKNRMAAVSHGPDNQRILKRIAQEDSSAGVRATAVARITESALLVKFALEDLQPEVRIAAVNRIYDPGILGTIATTDKHPAVRLAAIRKISDPVLLTEFIIKETDIELVSMLLEKITDQKDLLNISLNASLWLIRSKAFSRLENNALAELVQLAKDPAILIAAKIRLGRTTWKEEFASPNLSELVGAVALVMDPLPASSEIVKICHNFIALGDASRIPELESLLFRFGDVTLAEDYLNCGNTQLEGAGRKWATDHGYDVNVGQGSHRVSWGEKK